MRLLTSPEEFGLQAIKLLVINLFCFGIEIAAWY